MKRLHLFEIHDQDWCPRAIRDAETDYLQFIITRTKPYAEMVPVLAAALRRTGARQIVDLCSGAGGPWTWLQPLLANQGINVGVCLTDKYPNLGAVSSSNDQPNQAIRYFPRPVDALRVPAELAGFRTMFTASHHFRPEDVSALLADAVRHRQGIALFEGTYRSAPAFLVTLLLPLTILVVTPFIRPFRWSRLFWTYLLPVVPLTCAFDYLVSCLRTYSVRELGEITRELRAGDYQWEMGELKIRASPVPLTYLVGVPINPS